MKIGCVIYGVGAIHGALAECATKSFKKFHPGIEVHQITSENISTFKVFEEFEKKYGGEHGIFRWGVVLEIWEKYEYDKIIMLGADTITCAHLGEFINRNDVDAILTLDEPYQLHITSIPRDVKTGQYDDSYPLRSTYTPTLIKSVEYGSQIRFERLTAGPLGKFVRDPKSQISHIEYTHCNSDVTCFNNSECLRAVHDYYFRYIEDFDFSNKNSQLLANRNTILTGRRPCHINTECYNEQATLNLLLTLSLARGLDKYEEMFVEPARIYGWDKLLAYKATIADIPRTEDTSLYNVRSKKRRVDRSVQYYLQASDFDGEWIPCECQSTRNFKVINKKLYTEDNYQIKVWHYGSSTAESADNVNSFIYYKFNNDTKEFFKNECDCGDFFEKPFMVKTEG
jgi:hypothetical protein